MLIPPQMRKPFKLYVAVGDHTIGSTLMQEFEEKERVIFYLSRRLLDPETRYSLIEKFVCAYIFHAPNFDIICYLLNAQWCLSLM
jgi:hypothetical protein